MLQIEYIEYQKQIIVYSVVPDQRNDNTVSIL